MPLGASVNKDEAQGAFVGARQKDSQLVAERHRGEQLDSVSDRTGHQGYRRTGGTMATVATALQQSVRSTVLCLCFIKRRHADCGINTRR